MRVLFSEVVKTFVVFFVGLFALMTVVSVVKSALTGSPWPWAYLLSMAGKMAFAVLVTAVAVAVGRAYDTRSEREEDASRMDK